MLPQAQRLHKTTDIAATYHAGRKYTHRLFRVHCRSNGLTGSRVTVVISTKIAKRAVDRNYMKRRLRASIRQYLPNLRLPSDLIVVGHAALRDATFQEIDQAMQYLLRNSVI